MTFFQLINGKHSFYHAVKSGKEKKPTFQEINLLLVLKQRMQGKKQGERFLAWFLALLTRFMSFTANIIPTQNEV